MNLFFLPSLGRSIIPQQCGFYEDCERCTGHLADRDCGWCDETNTCEYAPNSTCNFFKFHYKDNRKCGQRITPTPAPAPTYKVNTTFCRLLSGTWCTKCVTEDPDYHCGWCFDTNECLMGSENGPYSTKCRKWSYENDDQCQGKVSSGGIVALRVVLGIVVGGFIAAGVIICYCQVKKKKTPSDYQPIQD